MEPFEISSNSGYTQYNQNGYYNQPYQPYSNPPSYPQAPQGYSYPAMNVGVGNGPNNPQYAQNVRWNDNMANNYRKPWLIWSFWFIY